MVMKITVCWDMIPISIRNLGIQRNLAASIFEVTQYDKQEKDSAIIYTYIYIHIYIYVCVCGKI